MVTQNKTQPTNAKVEAFLDAVPNNQRRADARKIVQIMQEQSGEPPVMWGSSIVGFGTYSYKYASGREGDWMVIGFSPRKQALVLYGLLDYEGNREALEALGSVKTGKGCLYVNTLQDVDVEVLKTMIKNTFVHPKQS